LLFKNFKFFDDYEEYFYSLTLLKEGKNWLKKVTTKKETYYSLKTVEKQKTGPTLPFLIYKMQRFDSLGAAVSFLNIENDPKVYAIINFKRYCKDNDNYIDVMKIQQNGVTIAQSAYEGYYVTHTQRKTHSNLGEALNYCKNYDVRNSTAPAHCKIFEKMKKFASEYPIIQTDPNPKAHFFNNPFDPIEIYASNLPNVLKEDILKKKEKYGKLNSQSKMDNRFSPSKNQSE